MSRTHGARTRRDPGPAPTRRLPHTTGSQRSPSTDMLQTCHRPWSHVVLDAPRTHKPQHNARARRRQVTGQAHEDARPDSSVSIRRYAARLSGLMPNSAAQRTEALRKRFYRSPPREISDHGHDHGHDHRSCPRGRDAHGDCGPTTPRLVLPAARATFPVRSTHPVASLHDKVSEGMWPVPRHWTDKTDPARHQSRSLLSRSASSIRLT